MLPQVSVHSRGCFANRVTTLEAAVAVNVLSKKIKWFTAEPPETGFRAGIFCYLDSSQLEDKEKGTSLFTEPPWDLPWGRLWAGLVEAAVVIES